MLAARTLDILPAAAPDAAPVVATPPAAAPTPEPAAAGQAALPQPPATGLWPWLSLGLGLLWLATLIAWRRSARPAGAARAAPPVMGPAVRQAVTEDARRSERAFRLACLDDNPQAARLALLAWAQATWPQDPPGGLAALARRLADARLPGLLRELDRACYAGGVWPGEALAQALTTLAAGPQASGKPAEPAGLYP